MSKSRQYAILLDSERPVIKDSESQVDKFRDLARELECDEDAEAFKAKLRQIARAPKPSDPPASDQGEA